MPNNEIFVTAVDKAYYIIKNSILNGELKPGEKLSKRKMAPMADVSVSPVLEALNRLTEDGIVETKPQWGSYVTVFTPEKIDDMYALREAIECQEARILAKKMTEEQFEFGMVLATNLDNKKYGTNDINEIEETHLEFHSTLAKFTGFPSLQNTLKRCNIMWLLATADLERKHYAELPEDWHRKLLKSFMERDPDKAEQCMREHVSDSYLRTRERFSKA